MSFLLYNSPIVSAAINNYNQLPTALHVKAFYDFLMLIMINEVYFFVGVCDFVRTQTSTFQGIKITGNTLLPFFESLKNGKVVISSFYYLINNFMNHLYKSSNMG